MDTALLAYSGISVKMLVDRDFGADLVTMFTVDYETGGAAQAHDHPFEEAYFFLEGEIEGEIDGADVPRSGPGDVVFAGVGQRPRVLQRGHGAGPLDRDAGAAAAGSPCLPLGPRVGSDTRKEARDVGRRCSGGRRRHARRSASRSLDTYAETGHEVVVTGQTREQASMRRSPRSKGTSTGLTFDLAEA